MNRMMIAVLIALTLTASAFAQIKTPAKRKHFPIASPAQKLVSPKPTPALPWWADPAYPIIHHSRPMDVLQILAFGLRPAVLTEEWKALNWYEDRGGFHLDILPVGTIVLVDQGGRVLYKYDCSNRLVPPTSGFADWPSTSTVLPTTGPTTALPTTSYQGLNNWLSRFSNRIWSFFE